MFQSPVDKLNPGLTPSSPIDRFANIAKIQSLIEGGQLQRDRLALDQQKLQQENDDRRVAQEDFAKIQQIMAESDGNIEKDIDKILKAGVRNTEFIQRLSVIAQNRKAAVPKTSVIETVKDGKAGRTVIDEAKSIGNFYESPEKPDTSITEVDLARKAAAGDYEAANALEILKAQRPQSTATKDYGEREVEHDGKVWIQTYAKDDPQAVTISERPKQPIRLPASQTPAATPASAMPIDLQDALNRATMTMPATRRAQVINTVNAQAGRGDTTAVRDTIRQAAMESEPVGVRSQISGRRELIKSLTEIQGLLAKVPQNLLVGTLEDTARKLGTTTNPELVKVGSRLLALSQSYRKSITGAQFSKAESEEYQKLLPGYSNTATVNQQLISGLLDEVAARDSVYWDYKLGKGWTDIPAKTAGASGGWKIISVK